jgi:hypothetical protein
MSNINHAEFVQGHQEDLCHRSQTTPELADTFIDNPRPQIAIHSAGLLTSNQAYHIEQMALRVAEAGTV